MGHLADAEPGGDERPTGVREGQPRRPSGARRAVRRRGRRRSRRRREQVAAPPVSDAAADAEQPRACTSEIESRPRRCPRSSPRPRARRRRGRTVVAAAAVEPVAAAVDGERVVARPADDRVVARPAPQPGRRSGAAQNVVAFTPATRSRPRFDRRRLRRRRARPRCPSDVDDVVAVAELDEQRLGESRAEHLVGTHERARHRRQHRRAVDEPDTARLLAHHESVRLPVGCNERDVDRVDVVAHDERTARGRRDEARRPR